MLEDTSKLRLDDSSMRPYFSSDLSHNLDVSSGGNHFDRLSLSNTASKPPVDYGARIMNNQSDIAGLGTAAV